MIESNQFPLIEIKLTTSSEVNRIKLEASLVGLARNDSQLVFTTESESDETLIGGKSEIHLDSIIKSLQSHGLVFKIGAPQVSYRETITRGVHTDYTFKKSVAGQAEYARVVLAIEPAARGAGNTLNSEAINNSDLIKFLPAVAKGIYSVLSSGPIIGFPIVDLNVTWLDGAYHEVDSSQLAFEVAARTAIRQMIDDASPVLLEPIMKVKITMPEPYLGVVIESLNSRCGKVLGTTDRNKMCAIDALVSLANMFGYGLSLQNISNGLAAFTMDFSHYQIVGPPSDPDNFSPAVAKRA
jgi:elongation factor G